MSPQRSFILQAIYNWHIFLSSHTKSNRHLAAPPSDNVCVIYPSVFMSKNNNNLNAGTEIQDVWIPSAALVIFLGWQSNIHLCCSFSYCNRRTQYFKHTVAREMLYVCFLLGARGLSFHLKVMKMRCSESPFGHLGQLSALTLHTGNTWETHTSWPCTQTSSD